MHAYLELESLFRKIYYLEGAEAVLGWDSAVMMPAGSYKVRGEQIATINTVIHQMITSPRINDLISEAQTESRSLNEWQCANLMEITRIWKHKNAVPEELVAKQANYGTECEMIWRKARKENNFAEFSPYLEKVLEVTRDIAQAKSESLGCSPYDAMIDQFDPGLTAKEIDIIFADLKQFLPSFTEEVVEQQKSQTILDVTEQNQFPTDKQKQLGLHCLKVAGFNFDMGRFDESVHPFCGGVPDDIRITTRYDASDFTSALMGVMHESGHALYENQLPIDWREQPVGHARGMAMHESQSLLVEMQISRSQEFLSYLQPTIKESFSVNGDAWSIQNLSALYTKVERGFIRVDADEVTYPAHIMLRYDLEKALISGELSVKELPSAWNELMQKYIGVIPDSDANGCMQDIHWTDGSFGYFPSYTLGAIIAAQVFAKIKSELPNTMNDIANGDFSSIHTWLKEKIHSQGSKYSTSDLLKQATGKTICTDDYKEHLKTRYLTP